MDKRFAKTLRFGRTRTNVGIDIDNILNANPVLTWQRPNAILSGRFRILSP